MSKIACYYSYNALSDNDIFFAVKFSDEDYERGKALALEGWNAWWEIEFVDEGDLDTTKFPHMTKEEFLELWNLGYEEGAINLLDAAGIKYELIENTGCPDENSGWPLWFDPTTITDWYENGDKIKEGK